MNTLSCFYKLAYKLGQIVVIFTILVSACTTSTSISTATQPPAPTISIKTIADDISKDVGKVMQIVDGSSNRQVIVFEETHVSPAGQVEIAIMMNRLYENYGLRQIALEGYFKENGKLDASWLQKFPSLTAKQPIREKECAIVQLLQDGEISSSEMMALTYSDVIVTGIEVAGEYNYDPPDNAWNASMIYLYLIAAPGMTDEEINQANELLNADKILEGIEYIISTDAWTSKEYALMNDKTKIISEEGELEILDEIEAKANEVGADISAEDKQAMKDLRKFFETAIQRTNTMVKNLLTIDSPNAPIAMVTGAAHTEFIVNLLTEKGVSFAIIRGNALANNQENGDLSYYAYDRKTQQLSIDQPGTLGILLDSRKKPQPVTNKVWFQSKAQIYILTDMIAKAVARNKKPPFDDILRGFTNVKVDPLSIVIKGNNVIFSVTAPDDDGNEVTIYVRARADKEIANQLLEDRLKLSLDNVQRKDKPGDEKEPRMI